MYTSAADYFMSLSAQLAYIKE